MKFVYGVLTGLLVLGAGNVFANEPEQVYSCSLNKTFSLVISLHSEEGAFQSVVLETKDFLGRVEEHIVTLKRPSMQLIHYGNVLMIAQDFGRSGYVFIRLEKSSGNSYEGKIDINLFFKGVSSLTGGELTQLACMRLGSEAGDQL